MKPRALDLFCGAGGVAMGLHRTGFEVVGVDLAKQPHYPFTFIRGDALEASIKGFDFIWASPPCQCYSASTKALRNEGREYPDLIEPTRAKLIASGKPYIIENVVGAPLRNTTMLCGTMFGLKLLRHRLFETSWPIPALTLSCSHQGDEIPVYGHGTPSWHKHRNGREGRGNYSTAEKRIAMGIDWMTLDELSQAIPPAYSEWLARHAMDLLRPKKLGKTQRATGVAKTP